MVPDVCGGENVPAGAHKRYPRGSPSPLVRYATAATSAYHFVPAVESLHRRGIPERG
jgi:hypothetical protein